MSAGWEIGDLALCIAAGKITQKGRIYTVAGVLPAGAQDGAGYSFIIDSIALEGVAGPVYPVWWVGAQRFRKILPDKHEACEDEFVTLLNRIKQPVEAERSALFMGGK